MIHSAVNVWLVTPKSFKMNRPKPTALRRPSAAKPSGMKPPSVVMLISYVRGFTLLRPKIIKLLWFLSQVILHLEISSLWDQRPRVESLKPQLSFWSQQPLVYLLTVRERLPLLCRLHQGCPALQSDPNFLPHLLSVPLGDLPRLQPLTRGPYLPQLRSPQWYLLKVTHWLCASYCTRHWNTDLTHGYKTFSSLKPYCFSKL